MVWVESVDNDMFMANLKKQIYTAGYIRVTHDKQSTLRFAEDSGAGRSDEIDTAVTLTNFYQIWKAGGPLFSTSISIYGKA